MSTLNFADYDVNFDTGFLPNPDPLTRLPSYFEAWDTLGHHLPALLLAGQLRSWVQAMPHLDPARLVGKAELERAMLLLSTLANAYVWADAKPAHVLPRNLAVPLWQVTERLGRKPIIGHAANVLHNWRRLDPNGPISLDNLALLQPFLNSSDEAWFVLVTVAIEADGAKVLPLLLQAQHAVEANDIAALENGLIRIEQGIAQMSATLMRMYEKCDPHIFYHRVRPFLASWPAPGVVYEGVSDTPYIFAGGSAGQSSLIQTLDAAFGVRHTSEHSRHFLAEMRHYMPPPHRAFIVAVEQQFNLRGFVEAQQNQHPSLLAAFNRCIETLTDFRKKHMEIAIRYITMQAPKGTEAIGTGGTSLAQMLGAAKQQTRDSVINR
ncbi:MAG: indoleamine 2,3-dioxygenase [Anaerolineae bacterium]|nr:indoleamine 2,3-dioxygenase [Anaerolineae bacterium]